MTKIIFNPEKISLPPGNGYSFYGREEVEVEIKVVKVEREWHLPVAAGENELTPEDFSRLQSMAEYQWFLSQGILVVPSDESAPSLPPENPPLEESPPPEEPQFTDISALSITKAEPVIKAEERESVLRIWAQDPRAGIKDLVLDRLLELGLEV
jgi:hypothetical protein